MRAAVRRVLILKPCCIGDVLMASPLATAIKARWPDADIDWAADPHVAEVVAGIPGARVLSAPGCTPGRLEPASLARLIAIVAANRYDMALVPDRSPALAAIPWLARVSVRVGLSSGARGWFHSHRVPLGGALHEADLYRRVAQAADIDTGDWRPVYVPAEMDRIAAAGVLPQGGSPSAPESAWGRSGDVRTGASPAAASRLVGGVPLRVAVHPGGGVNPGMTLVEKRWPAERFAEVVRRLIDDYRAQVLLLGARSDRAAVAELVSRLPEASVLRMAPGSPPTAERPVLDFSELAGIGMTAALLERVDVMLGNDTGVAHLAMAVGTPAVMIFGPSDPRRYGPLPGRGTSVAPMAGQGAVTQLREAQGSDAINSVTVEQVWNALRPYIEKAR